MIKFVTSLDQCMCKPDIGVGTALHAMACRVNGTPEATTPDLYGYKFHCVENIDPFEVVLIQSLFPPVVIRYDEIPVIIEKYHGLTSGLKRVLVNAIEPTQWFVATPDFKKELLKIKK